MRDRPCATTMVNGAPSADSVSVVHPNQRARVGRGRFAFARCGHVSPARAEVLRQRGRACRRECETHHTRIAALALLLRVAGGGLSRICDNDDAAVDVLVVQGRDVRAISRSLPVPASRALSATCDISSARSICETLRRRPASRRAPSRPDRSACRRSCRGCAAGASREYGRHWTGSG